VSNSGPWGAYGPPNVLPFSYGENTSGAYGRLQVIPGEDHRRTWDNTHGMNRRDPNLPSHAAPIDPAAGGVRPFSTIDPGVAFSQTAVQELQTPYAQQYEMAGDSELGKLTDLFKIDPEKKAARQAQRATRQASRSRVISGSGGYKYRQYANGDIVVLPGSPSLVGRRITSTNNYKKWQAITAEIGDFSLASSSLVTLNTALQALTQVGTAFATGRQGGVAEEEFPMDEDMSMPAATGITTGIPGWLPLAAGGLLVGGLVIAALRRR